MKSPQHILETYWGHQSFRPQQQEIIEAVLRGQDTVALLPTGGGKSICFQIPALLKEGLCIVISPLISLMNDQVASLTNKGIKALAITGGISHQELHIRLDNARYGNYTFLYLSPERLQQELVQNVLKQCSVSLIAIDEAHCISQWGNDFRPSYRNITMLRDMHPLVPIIALTATATPEVLEDTIASLQLEMPQVYRSSFVRPNISYQVALAEDKLYAIEQLLKNNTGNTIIYVRNRKATVDLSQQLNAIGIASHFYHGGLPTKQKESNVAQWQKGTHRVMVATNAFGMGIDHPTVRFVIHTQFPESIESYFQEAGRAGRDEKPAQAVLLYSDYDFIQIKKQFVDTLATVDAIQKIYKKLNSYFYIPYGEGAFTNHNFNFLDFCKTYHLNTLVTYNGLQSLDRLGIISLSKEFGQKSTLHFICESAVALDYFKGNPLASVIGKTILRVYGGIFEMPTRVNLELIQQKTGQSIPIIIETLQKMQQDGLLDASFQTTDASITFLQPREDERAIHVVAKQIKAINDKKKQQVAAVIDYVNNKKTCRSQQLVSYFGEKTAAPCGICSVCTSAKKDPKVQTKEIKNVITQALEENNKTSRELAEIGACTSYQLVAVLQKMLDANLVGIDHQNKYYLK